jgi:peptidoglycan/xylan/chitin deacetylase (PgdA/CDA1 family)
LKKYILLTFDLEEFDLPLEYNCHIEEDERFRITNEGLQRLMPLLNKYHVRATFFTTSHYCEKNPSAIKSISDIHEIASHSHSHSRFSIEDPAKSKRILEHAIQKKVFGFRMPRLGEVNYQDLFEAGYRYDSSINPTFIPGRYNHFHHSRLPYVTAAGKIIEIPDRKSVV